MKIEKKRKILSTRSARLKAQMKIRRLQGVPGRTRRDTARKSQRKRR